MLQSQENDMCGEVRIRANLTESTEVSQQSPSVTTKSQSHNKVPDLHLVTQLQDGILEDVPILNQLSLA